MNTPTASAAVTAARITPGPAAARGAQSAALALRPGQAEFDKVQAAALAQLGVKNATDADLIVYLHYCQRTGLDPFARQIYMIERREKQGEKWVSKQTIQVGIDGYRVIRDRIARRDGLTVEYEDTVWYDRDGNGYGVWLWDTPPAGCKVTVVVDGRRFPAVCRTASYMQVKDGHPTGQWRNQPDHMIEKCAEAFALRRAFPNDLSGLALDDEMPVAEEEPPAPRVTGASIRQRQVVKADVEQRTAGAGDTRDQAHGQDRGMGADRVTASGSQRTQPGDADDPGPSHPGSDTPGRINPKLADVIRTHFERLGYTDRAERLRITSTIIGRDVTSTSDLNPTEGRAAAALLARCKTPEQLLTALSSGDKPEGGEGGTDG